MDDTEHAILADFFGPLDPAGFLMHHYATQALHMPAAFDPACFTLDDFDALIRIPGLLERQRTLVRAQGSNETTRVVSAEQVYRHLSHGETVQMVGLEEILPDTHPVIRVFRAFELFLQAPGRGITVFLSAPGEQALPMHHDLYEVVTLQLAGSKTWNLYDFVPPNHAQGGVYDVTLQSSHPLAGGDGLYMPTCQVHHVLPGPGPSLSVALAFQPPRWTELLDDLHGILSDDPLFWRAIPPGDPATGVEARRAALHAAVDRLDPAVFAQDLAMRRTRVMPGLPTPHLNAALATDGIDDATRLMVRPGPRPRLHRDGAKVLLVNAHGPDVEAPARAEQAFRFIAQVDGPFRAADICKALDAASKLNIVRNLVRRGVLQPAPD